MPFSALPTVRWVGLKEIQLKAIKMGPTILVENRAMVTQMLDAVVAEIEPETPFGPGHFGYHLRDRYRVEVVSEGTRTSGKLRAPMQGYWREFGTRKGYRGRRNRLRAFTAAFERQNYGGSGGEKAGLFATKALNGVRRMIRFYYGKAQWWRL